MKPRFTWAHLFSPSKWLRYWELRGEIKRHQAWANDKLALSVLAPSKQKDGVLLEENRLYWAKHYLAKGANPNYRAVSSYAMDERVGRYRSLKGRRSMLSLSLLYPTICKTLVEEGAVFDRSAMEAAIYVINLEQWKKRETPNTAWDMSDIAASIEALFSSPKITASLHQNYVDLSDMQIKPAYQILGRLYPGARAFAEQFVLQQETVEVATEAHTRPRL